MEFLTKLELKKAIHKDYFQHGITTYTNIEHLLLEFNSVCKNLAKGNDIKTFYKQERALYSPFIEILNYHIPTSSIVNEENLLYKTTSPRSKTDISIRELSHCDKQRKDTSTNYTHFIEIKSLLHGDELKSDDIELDLIKLAKCEDSYDAICFFVLIGLENELKKNKLYLTLLGNLEENKKSFKITTIEKQEIYLRPAVKYLATEPYIFVFEISNTNNFNKKTGIEYSIFQKISI